jgi:hypothetical protein
MLGAFIVPNVGAFLFITVRPCHDCVKHLGWPLIFFEEGGIVWRRTFSGAALCGDIAIALIASALWAMAYENRVKILQIGRIAKRYLSRELRASWQDFRRKLR